jgi:hypothetical protein
MESPFAVWDFNGDFLNLNGTTVRPGGGRPINCFVRIPGPTQKVLFVVVDIQTSSSSTRIDVGNVAFDTVANSVVSTAPGADLDLSASFNDLFGSYDRLCNSLYSCLSHWVRYFGNYEDWSTAMLAVADVSSYQSPGLVRVGDTINGLMVDGNLALPMFPFAGAPRYSSDADVDAWATWVSFASGSRGREFRDREFRDFANSNEELLHATHLIPRLDPAIYVGAAAGWYDYTFTAKPDSFGLANVAYSLLRLSVSLFVYTDELWASRGLGLISLYSPANTTERNILDKFRQAWRDNLEPVFYTGAIDLTYTGNYDRSLDYTIYPSLVGQEFLLPAYRVNTVWKQSLLGSSGTLVDDDYFGLPGAQYKVVQNGVNRYDRLIYNQEDLMGAPEKSASLRKMFCVGTFSVGNVSTAWLKYLDAAGNTVSPLAIVVCSPAAGSLMYQSYKGIYTSTQDYDYVDIVGGQPLILFDPSKNFRRIYLALESRRQLLHGKSAPQPALVVRTDQLSNLTGDNFADSENIDVPGMMSGFGQW